MKDLDDLAFEMDNPHWCQCGWIDALAGSVWWECESCGYVRIPLDSVWQFENLLMGFTDGFPVEEMDQDWGPFFWHPDMEDVVKSMSDSDAVWTVKAGEKSWMELIGPEIERRLERFTPEQICTLLENASPRWLAWLTARLRLVSTERKAAWLAGTGSRQCRALLITQIL